MPRVQHPEVFIFVLNNVILQKRIYIWLQHHVGSRPMPHTSFITRHEVEVESHRKDAEKKVKSERQPPMPTERKHITCTPAFSFTISSSRAPSTGTHIVNTLMVKSMNLLIRYLQRTGYNRKHARGRISSRALTQMSPESTDPREGLLGWPLRWDASDLTRGRDAGSSTGIARKAPRALKICHLNEANVWYRT